MVGMIQIDYDRGLLVAGQGVIFCRKQPAAEIAGRTCGALVRVWPEESHMAFAKAQRESLIVSTK